MMKKNKKITRWIKGTLLIVGLPLGLVSCGSYGSTVFYGDGIYGEELPVERTERVVYKNTENSTTQPNQYRSYFNDMANKSKGMEVLSIQPPTHYDSTASQNYNPSSYNHQYSPDTRGNVNINIYDDYWGYQNDPFYPHSYYNDYYWGMGAWSPYYRSSWGYYGPRNRISFGFGWGSGWNYPYYSYGYGYNPYYGYIPYYGYYDPFYYGGYYPYYGNRVYRNSNNYVYARGRRGGNMDYSSSRNTRTRGEYNNRSYSRRGSNVTPNRSYSRISRGSYTPSSNNSNSYSRKTTPTYSRSYERSNSSSSSRSYNKASNPSSGRTYSRGHRGG